jgi:hypothetical protein
VAGRHRLRVASSRLANRGCRAAATRVGLHHLALSAEVAALATTSALKARWMRVSGGEQDLPGRAALVDRGEGSDDVIELADLADHGVDGP